ELDELWLESITAIVCARTARCPNPQCSDEWPLRAGLDRETSSSSSTRAPYSRGQATCLRCGTVFNVRPREAERWVPVTMVADGQREELPVPPDVAEVLSSASYPANIASRLDEVWAVGRSAAITYRIGVTARQATVLDALRRSVRHARDAMADEGYTPDRIVALSTYLGLAASDLVDYLCTGARMRQGRIQPALVRGAWTLSVEFAEIGGSAIARLWQRRIEAMTAVIDANAQLPEAVSAVPGDMTMLPLESESADFIVWDPPFYDNIDYDLLAAPWTSFLRSVMGELDTTLFWPQVNLSSKMQLP